MIGLQAVDETCRSARGAVQSLQQDDTHVIDENVLPGARRRAGQGAAQDGQTMGCDQCRCADHTPSRSQTSPYRQAIREGGVNASSISPPPARPFEATRLDGNRIAIGDPMRLAVDRLYEAMLAAEVDRVRKRRLTAAEADRRALEAVVCAAYWDARRGTWLWLSISTGKHKGQVHVTRYTSPALAHRRALARAVHFLFDHGYLQFAKGYSKPDARTGGMSYEALPSKVRATAALVSFVEAECGATVDDIGDGPCESIILRGPKPDTKDTPGPAMNYADTAATCRMRDELATINAGVARAAITLEPGAAALADGAGDDRAGTSLRRIFNNGTFDQGGRMYGHWAQTVPRRERHRLRIAGEAVVEVDFAALHPRMLYQQRGIPYSAADPYDPAMLGLADVPRAAVKEAFMRLVNRDTPPSKATDASSRRIVAALTAAHAPIADAFYSGAGLTLQRLDSDIAARVMLALVADDTAAIPLHDGFLVRARDVAATKRAMMLAYEAVLGEGAATVITVKDYAEAEPSV